MADFEGDEIADYQEVEVNGGFEPTEPVSGGVGVGAVEPEQFKQRVLEMEEELEKLTRMEQQVEKQITSATDKIDETSIYVGQVDYEATPEELRAHFAPCGTINRITIVCDKITGRAKGYGYIEFADSESVDNALKLDDSMFKGRQLKVLPKRQNVPTAFPRGGGGGRGAYRGGAGRGAPGPVFGGRGRGAPRGGGYFAGGAPAGRGAPFRGGGAGGRWSGGGAPAAARGGGFRGGGRGGRTPYY